MINGYNRDKFRLNTYVYKRRLMGKFYRFHAKTNRLKYIYLLTYYVMGIGVNIF